MRLVLALVAVVSVFAGIVSLYRVDLRALNGAAERPAARTRVGRSWRWLVTPTAQRSQLVWMNCPVCHRQVEVPKSGTARYPEELIAACRKQNGTSCGPFYDYIRGPLGL